MLLWGFFVAGN